MAIKVHTCPNTWIHGPHPCWKVLKAVQDSGMPYEQVKEPLLHGRRTSVKEHTGQDRLPALELDDGTWIREESSDLVGRIQAGEFSAGPEATATQ